MAKIPESTAVHSKMCPICCSSERAEIERCVLSMGPSNPALTLDAIADAFGVTVKDLRVHTLMHTPLALDFSLESEAALIDSFQSRAGVQPTDATSRQGVASDSNNITFKDRLTDKVNLREGDMLLASANEMLTTLTAIGRRIKAYAGDGNDGSDQRLVAFCSNSLVNLFVNTSSELRKNIEAISELNSKINGAEDDGTEGLKALASVLAGSMNQSKATEDDKEEE